MDAPIVQAARQLARRCSHVFVSTLEAPEGGPDTRVMFNLLRHRAAVLDQGPAALPSPFQTWLGTNTSSRKVGQLRRDPRVCLYYADTASFEGLALYGRVSEVLDPAVRAALWTDEWAGYYPGGLDGGDFTLLHFQPSSGRYYHDLQVTDLAVEQLA